MQALGPNLCASYISNGKQGRIHRDKYLKAGDKYLKARLPCVVAIVVGADPITYFQAATR